MFTNFSASSCDFLLSPIDIDNFINYSYNNCYIALYPELFLLIIISSLIGFLVILDYLYEYKFLLSTLTAHILI